MPAKKEHSDFIMKKLMTFLLALWAMSMQAQGMKEQGTSVEDIVPQGWTHDEVTGDLNKDGLADLVIVTRSNQEDNMFTREDGYVYNFNKPVLAIYFAEANGQLKLWKQYDEVLQPNTDICINEIELQITDRGVLRISTSMECSMGSWTTSSVNFSFRYQNGDFYMIGKETNSLQRNSGDVEVVSENYLTWKRQVVKSHISDEKPLSEKWTRLQRRPLEKLGARLLADE